MRKNMVLVWGKFVGTTRKTWGQILWFYTKIRKTSIVQPTPKQSFTKLSRRFSQTLSTTQKRLPSLLMADFYPLSTPINNNNFSKY